MSRPRLGTEAYARTRIERLRVKIAGLTADINRMAMPPVGQQASLQIDQLMRHRRSSIAAIKRWERQLVDAGLLRIEESIYLKGSNR